jgi:hypothetical protein
MPITEFRKLRKNFDGTNLIRVIFEDTHRNGRTACVREMRGELKRDRPMIIIADVKREAIMIQEEGGPLDERSKFDQSELKMGFRKTPASSAFHSHYDTSGMDCCLH